MSLLKFRCFYLGRMVSVENIQFKDDGSVMVNFELMVQPENVMQFTGVLDFYGKEIYDGDILNLKKLKNVETFGVVKFTSGSWRAHFSHYKFLVNRSQHKYCHFEVMGNIWQNENLIIPHNVINRPSYNFAP